MQCLHHISTGTIIARRSRNLNCCTQCIETHVLATISHHSLLPTTPNCYQIGFQVISFWVVWHVQTTLQMELQSLLQHPF